MKTFNLQFFTVLCIGFMLYNTEFSFGDEIADLDHPAQAELKENLDKYVGIAMSGTLVVDHVGPAAVEEGTRLLREHGAAANTILLKLIEKRQPGQFSSLYEVNVLRLTVASDREGSLMVARRYRSCIDEELIRYDIAPDAKRFLEEMKEEERNTYLRLLERRKDVQRFIFDQRPKAGDPA